jgi:hypothetical protein
MMSAMNLIRSKKKLKKNAYRMVRGFPSNSHPEDLLSCDADCCDTPSCSFWNSCS